MSIEDDQNWYAFSSIDYYGDLLRYGSFLDATRHLRFLNDGICTRSFGPWKVRLLESDDTPGRTQRFEYFHSSYEDMGLMED